MFSVQESHGLWSQPYILASFPLPPAYQKGCNLKEQAEEEGAEGAKVMEMQLKTKSGVWGVSGAQNKGPRVYI